MAVVDPRGGPEAWIGVVFGPQTRGRGRSDMEDAACVELLPDMPAAGVPCPSCGAGMKLLPDGRPAARVPVQMVGCPSCGFIGLCAD